MQVALAKYEFYENEWKGISEGAKDIVRQLLVVDPTARFTMDQVLKTKCTQTTNPLRPDENRPRDDVPPSWTCSNTTS